MRTLEDVIIKVDQVNSFMDAIEGVMIDATPDDSDPSAKRLHNLVYLLNTHLRFLWTAVETRQTTPVNYEKWKILHNTLKNMVTCWKILTKSQ